MRPIEFALLATAGVMGGMTLLWLVSLILRDSGIVDIFWGMAFVIVAWLGVVAGSGSLERRWLLATLVSIWGLRLSLRIGRRNLGKPEDFRYAAWRQAAGRAWWWRSLFKVFGLQGAVAMMVALPLIAGATGATPATLTIVDLIGVVAWIVGFTFEAVGDFQLDRFRRDPGNRGSILDTGLWGWTRHPNYFGDALLWWGFGIISVLTPLGVPALLGPALMSFLLVRVSGVAMLERAMSTRPGWDLYASRTNTFFPRPPPAD